MEFVVDSIQWSLLLYFVVLNAGYIGLNLLAFRELSRCMQTRALETLPQVYSGLEIPITLIVPAHNEGLTIVNSVQSLLQLNYPEFEVLVVNDGSKDATLEVLKREFGLELVPEAFRVRVDCKPVHGVYRSRTHPNLRVIDKDNGGKADALNAGINAARYPLFCSLDADSVLQRDSLHRVVLPFLEDSRTVAAGGIVRLLNGCDVSNGFLVRAGLPRNPLAIIQVVEYLRAFLFGRLGWSPLNAVLCISGAFGLFHKETVIAAGGFRTDTVGEDMELVMRLHRLLRHQRKPYRIVFVPDPVCWTEAPESRRVLRSQRIRWQRGLAESLSLNRDLLFSRNGGVLGWVAFPFAVLFEFASPIVELAGYLFFALGLALGVVSIESTLTFLALAMGMGIVLSMTGLLLEEMAFHVYPKTSDILILFLAVLLENFGYRQMNGVWRLIGLWQWATGRKAAWGEMTRTATWQRDPVGLRH
jgi:cellulose synthase/poly-beta-1,6-N-acetylglucosamine synthase-like glycosyltransferase